MFQARETGEVRLLPEGRVDPIANLAKGFRNQKGEN